MYGKLPAWTCRLSLHGRKHLMGICFTMMSKCRKLQPKSLSRGRSFAAVTYSAKQLHLHTVIIFNRLVSFKYSMNHKLSYIQWWQILFGQSTLCVVNWYVLGWSDRPLKCFLPLSFKIILEAYWGFKMRYYMFLNLRWLQSYRSSKFELHKNSVFA